MSAAQPVSGAAPSDKPAAPETWQHRQDRTELIRLLAMAHRRLDAQGVARIVDRPAT